LEIAADGFGFLKARQVQDQLVIVCFKFGHVILVSLETDPSVRESWCAHLVIRLRAQTKTAGGTTQSRQSHRLCPAAPSSAHR
jgi:hypothetical protein